MRFGQKLAYIASSYILILELCMLLLAYPGWADVLLREDFDNPDDLAVDLYQWCIGVGGEQGTISIVDGVAKIENMICSVDSSTGVYKIEPWGNYELVARLRMIDFGSDWSGVRLLIRTRPSSGASGYDGQFMTDHWLILRPTNELLPDSVDSQNISLGEWYEVRVIANGRVVTYFFDGEKVKEDSVDTFASGGFVISAIGGEVEFWLDYVEVRELAPTSVHHDPKITTCWAKLRR